MGLVHFHRKSFNHARVYVMTIIGLLLTAFTLINVPLAIAWFDVKFYEKWEKAIERLCEFDTVFCVILFLILIIFPQAVDYLTSEI